ncbi:MAG: IPT/TIG domain-containing protein [Micropruina sp.]
MALASLPGTPAAWAEPDPGSPPATQAGSAAPAVVKGVAPARGPLAGGTVVTLTGTGFTGATAVLFAGKPGSKLTVSSDTRLTVTAPPGYATVNVRVVTAAGTSAPSAEAKYRYVEPPRVIRVYPDAARLGKKVEVEISGTGFVDVTKVMFGNSRATDIRVTSESRITVTSPAFYKSDAVDVQVVTAHGTSKPGTYTRFHAVPAPWLHWLTPSSGPATGGNTVTVHGSALVRPQTVIFGDKAGSNLKSLDDNTLTVTVPPGKPGTTVRVLVFTPYGHNTSPLSYTYKPAAVPAPTITGVTPATGPTTGGTTLTITGTNLAGASKVSVGGAPATAVKVVSPTTVTAVTPAHAAGAVDVTLTTPGGSVTKAKAFSYTTVCTPTVIEVSGDITSAVTWKSDCGTVYHVNGTVTITAPDGSLRIPAGAIVKFADAAALSVSWGSLIVEGTAAKPVVFTSIHDDTAGGDTNGNGNATKPTAGDWGGIDAANWFASVRANALDLRYGSGIDSWNAGSVAVTNSTLTNVRGGISAGRDVAFGSSQPIIITGNTLTSSGTISATSRNVSDDASPVQVRDNTVIDSTSTGPAYSINDPRLQPSNLTGNTARGGRVNAIRIYGTLIENWTLPTTGLPYIVGTPSRTVGAPWDSDGLSIAKGVTLTVPAGAVLKFERTPGQPPLYSGISGDGTLIVNGTAAKPVVFTSIHDDTAGGDTNGNGNATQPAAGDWDGLVIRDTGALNASFLELRYTGPDADAAPTIAGISPASGPAAGGTTVTITGTNLSGARCVILGTDAICREDAAFLRGSDTELVVVSRSHPAGVVDVAITTLRGTVTKKNGFTYLAD